MSDDGSLSQDLATRAKQLRRSAARMREVAQFLGGDKDNPRRLALAEGMEQEAALLDRGLHTVDGGRVVPWEP